MRQWRDPLRGITMPAGQRRVRRDVCFNPPIRNPANRWLPQPAPLQWPRERRVDAGTDEDRAYRLSFWSNTLCRGHVTADATWIPQGFDDEWHTMSASHEQQVMSNKMWGGRFSERPDADHGGNQRIHRCRSYLYAQDIAASRRMRAMLAAKDSSPQRCENIGRVLDTILSEIGKGTFDFKRALEDIHMNSSKARRADRPAAAGAYPRSHDQVATIPLYVRDTSTRWDAALAAFQRALVATGDRTCRHGAAGFTHLQDRQPVTFGHLPLAYVEMARVTVAASRPRAKRLTDRRSAPAASPYLVPDRRRPPPRRWASIADGQFAGCGLDRGFPCWKPVGGGDLRDDLSRFPRKSLVWTSPLGGLVAAQRQVHHRLVHHAARSATRMRRNWWRAKTGR